MSVKEQRGYGGCEIMNGLQETKQNAQQANIQVTRVCGTPAAGCVVPTEARMAG